MSLRAPIAIVVEIRADDRRWFRLARNIGDDGIALVRTLPLEVGRPVQIRIVMPSRSGWDLQNAVGPRAEALSLRAEVTSDDSQADDDRQNAGESTNGDVPGGNALQFIDPSLENRQAIFHYVKDRLGLHLR